MSVRIQILGHFATINKTEWECDNVVLLEFVKVIASDIKYGYTPWPDYTLAEMACKALGGKIIEATDPPEYVEGRVY